jgi:hypothetical protein
MEGMLTPPQVKLFARINLYVVSAFLSAKETALA